MEINNPRLTSTLPGRLTEALNSLPRLETVIIGDPTALHCFPHPSSVQCLKLFNIPPDCDDWEWLKTVDKLTELHISIREEEEDSGRPQVHKADHNSVTDSKTTLTVTKFMSNLPKTLTKLHVSITRSGANSGGLTVDCNRAKLTHVNDDETTLAVALVLELLPMYMRFQVLPFYIVVLFACLITSYSSAEFTSFNFVSLR